MVDEFQVDERGFTSDGYRRLDPVCMRSMYLSNLLYLTLVLIASVSAVVFSPELFGDAESTGRLVVSLVALVVIVYLLAGPIVFYRRYRYRMDQDKLEIRRGIVTITHDMVPLERIHQVKVIRGPINRHYGLADVEVTTAGGTVTIQMLREDVAESIASSLNDLVVGILRERV